MKTNHLVFLLCFVSILGSSCGLFDRIPDFNDGCLKEGNDKLVFETLVGPDTTHPSKVSIFFKLDDTDGYGIPNLTENDFGFYEKGANDDCHLLISSSEAERKIIKAPQEFQYNVTLVLDLSGSVVKDHLVELQKAAIEFIEIAESGAASSRLQMEIWWFDGEEALHSLVPLTNDFSLMKSGVNNILPSISTDNSTDLYGGIIQAVAATESSLNNLPTNIISGSSIIIFTDGKDRAQRETQANVVSTIMNADERISFYTIGLGSEIVKSDLKTIGQDGFIYAKNEDDLIESFTDLGLIVTSEANSYYFFEYCSPVRSGKVSLMIQAKYKSKKGELEIEYDATDFSGGCSL
ncbi:MAG: VWA domain-containing protein [Bacteroidia bacterium]